MDTTMPLDDPRCHGDAPDDYTGTSEGWGVPFRLSGHPDAICFFEACIPPKANHQAKRIVRVGGFAKLADKPQLVQAKSFWDTLFLLHRPPAMLEGPLSLTMELTWPWNASDSKKTRQAGAMWHLGPPDLDNVGKTCTDSMCRCGYFRNDSQIVQLCLTKRRGDQPGVRVALAMLGPAKEEGA